MNLQCSSVGVKNQAGSGDRRSVFFLNAPKNIQANGNMNVATIRALTPIWSIADSFLRRLPDIFQTPPEQSENDSENDNEK